VSCALFSWETVAGGKLFDCKKERQRSVGRWQRFFSRFFPPESDLIAQVDASEDGSALSVSLSATAQAKESETITGIDLARGRVRTREGQRRLTPAARQIAAVLVPGDASQRITRLEEGIVHIGEHALPDALQTLRALASGPDAPHVTETASARAIKLAERRPLHYEFQVDVAGEDGLVVTPQVASSDGKVALSPDALPSSGPEPSRWVRQGKTYYPVPAPVAPDVAEFARAPIVLRGDAVPFFLVRQIKQLQRNGRVIQTEAARQVRVASEPLEPVGVVDLDQEGWLQIGLHYRGGDETFTPEEIATLPPDARYIRRGSLWVPVDRRADVRAHEALVAVQRTLGARPDEQGRLRVAPGQGDEARRMLLNAVELDEGAAFQKFLADLAGFRQIDRVAPPKELRATLRPYQLDGFRWLAFLRKYYLNGVLADDMGLGKTITTLALLQYAKEHPDADVATPSIVICPTTVVDTWIDEAQKFTPGLRLVRYSGADRARALAGDDGVPPDVVVTTYETLRRDMGVLIEHPWDYVILDEAQKIKNPITDTARACRHLLARHRLAVTGTPIENRLDELWALFDFLMPGYLGSQARFRRDFEGPIVRDKSEGAADELKRKIAPFVLRRMKEQVASDLPPKLYVTRECQLTREQSDLYARIAGEGRARVLEQARSHHQVTLTMSILASLTHLKQICCHPALLEGDPLDAELHGRSGKFEAFKDVLAERLEIGEKVLVFSQFADMCRLIDRYLHEEGIPSLYLDGQTRNRQDLVRAFQSDPAIRVFVLSLRAAGFGITLTAASTVIHYDRWWNPAVENQATDRAYRIGQRRSVQVVQFQTVDTIEEKIDRMLTSKSELFGDVIGTDLGGKKISRQELLDLFAYSPLRDGPTEDNIPVATPIAAR
jgi:hypothetical protein